MKLKPGVFGALFVFSFGCTNTEPIQPGEVINPRYDIPVSIIPTRDKAVQADPSRGPRGYSTPGTRHNKGGASPGLGSGTNSSGAGGSVHKD